MRTPANRFTTLSQPVLASEVWATWSAEIEGDFTDLQGAGYRVRTDDIQLGNITHDRVNPERNESKPFTTPFKMGPSPTVKGFVISDPKGDDAGRFGGGRTYPRRRRKEGRAGRAGGGR